MADSGTDVRRALSNFALLIAGVWLLLTVIGVVVAVGGTADVPPIDILFFVIPGFALVPAAYYAVKVHQVADPAGQKRMLTRAGLFAVIGLALGIATIVIIAHTGN